MGVILAFNNVARSFPSLARMYTSFGRTYIHTLLPFLVIASEIIMNGSGKLRRRRVACDPDGGR